MNAKKCDRCGKFYTCYDGRVDLKEKKEENKFVYYNGHDSYDLCQECMEKLMSFFQNRDENSN